MADYDLLVIGGGPGGYTAALRGAERGARTAVIEAEQPGGACVNFACIPTNILLGSATSYLEAQEQSVMGVFQAGEQFNLGRAVARKDQLVQRLTGGIGTMLRTRGVELISGRAHFIDASTVEVARREGGSSRLTAEAFVIATGSRWEPEAIPGYPADRLLTADDVQSLTAPPASVLILADGPGEVPFGAEYAVLLASAGSEVTLATADASVFGGLDADLRPMAEAGLEALGVRLLRGATVGRHIGDGGLACGRPTARSKYRRRPRVIADPRKPFVEGLGLDAAGVQAPGHIPVDRACRTNVEHIFAVGDVTGGSMLTGCGEPHGRCRRRQRERRRSRHAATGDRPAGAHAARSWLDRHRRSDRARAGPRRSRGRGGPVVQRAGTGARRTRGRR
ncbi:MAG: FAD-dependent oxidoreductase [Dehalococcoidia bacterium]|nr:FAD-dependent oxidoreductase [Dehalococcoidia bacterium]